MQDRFGLPITTASASAVAAYLDGVDRLLMADQGAEQAFVRALAAAPDFALAHAALARSLQIAGRTTEAVRAANEGLRLSQGLTAREESHTKALALLIKGHPDALAAVQRHAVEFPFDLVVLMPAVAVFGLIGFSGRLDRNQYLLSFMQSLPPRLREDWWFASWYGFVHTETGQLAEGQRIVERALAANPRNANAIHALAHVFYEAGQPAAAASLLDAWLPGYERAAPLHCHLSWHRALSELESGHTGAAWEIYDDSLAPAAARLAPPINALTDAASFLWLAWLLGEEAPRERWEEVRLLADGFPLGVVYADLHAAIVYAVCDDRAALSARLASLQRATQVGSVGVQLTEGIIAFARGEFPRAADVLAGAKDEIVRVGGSGAQRDLFLHTLAAAYRRAGQLAEAEALLAHELARPRN